MVSLLYLFLFVGWRTGRSELRLHLLMSCSIEAGGWTYECDIVGTIKVAGSDKLRRVDNPHKVKVEKTFKVEGGKEGEDEGESAFKAEDA